MGRHKLKAKPPEYKQGYMAGFRAGQRGSGTSASAISGAAVEAQKRGYNAGFGDGLSAGARAEAERSFARLHKTKQERNEISARTMAKEFMARAYEKCVETQGAA